MKVGDKVVAHYVPASSRDYLTAGKEYEIIGLWTVGTVEGFHIETDDNEWEHCFALDGCAHLEGAGWELIKTGGTTMLGQTINAKDFYESVEKALETFALMEMKNADLRQALSIIANKGIVEEGSLQLTLTPSEAEIIKRGMAHL